VIDKILIRHFRLLKASYSFENGFLKILDRYKKKVLDELIKKDGLPLDFQILLAPFEEEMIAYLRSAEFQLRNSTNIFLTNLLDSYFSDYRRVGEATILGKPFEEMVRINLKKVRLDVEGAHKTMVVYGTDIPLLVKRIRGTSSMNYSDSIFNIHISRFRYLLKTFLCELSGNIHLQYYIKNKHRFPYVGIISPIYSQMTPQLYDLYSFENIYGGKPWTGVIQHYNQRSFPVPFETDIQFEKFPKNRWLESKSDFIQEDILGERLYRKWKSKKFSNSQIFSFRGSNLRLEQV